MKADHACQSPESCSCPDCRASAPSYPALWAASAARPGLSDFWNTALVGDQYARAGLPPLVRIPAAADTRYSLASHELNHSTTGHDRLLWWKAAQPLPTEQDALPASEQPQPQQKPSRPPRPRRPWTFREDNWGSGPGAAKYCCPKSVDIDILPRLTTDPSGFGWTLDVTMEFFENAACSCACCVPRQYISVEVREWDNIDLKAAALMGDATPTGPRSRRIALRRLMSSYDDLCGQPTREATMRLPLPGGARRPRLSHLLNVPGLPYYDASTLGAVYGKQRDDQWAYYPELSVAPSGAVFRRMFAEDVRWITGSQREDRVARNAQLTDDPSVPHVIEYDWPDSTTFMWNVIARRSPKALRDYDVFRYYRLQPDDCRRTWRDEPDHEVIGTARRTAVAYHFLIVARTKDLPWCAEGSPQAATMQIGTETISTRMIVEGVERQVKRNIKLIEAGLFVGDEFRRTFGFTLEGDGYTDDTGAFHVHDFSRERRVVSWRSPLAGAAPTSRAGSAR